MKGSPSNTNMKNACVIYLKATEKRNKWLEKRPGEPSQKDETT